MTGGAGIFRSYLCERLLNYGNEVVCLDNLFAARKANIVHLLSNPYFEFVRHHVIDLFKFEVDQIYKLACSAPPPRYHCNAIKMIKTLVTGAINWLGLAKRLKARVFQASTSEVYGDLDQHSQEESCWGNVNPIGIRWCYDEGSRCAENLFFDYHRQFRVDIRIARMFSTYGPRMLASDGRVVSNFIVQALKGENLTICGDGSQTRSFCFYSDLSEEFVPLMNQDEAERPVNLGNPGELTMIELAEAVLRLVDLKSKLVHLELPADYFRQRRLAILIAKDKLVWEPKIALEEGLVETIAYFRWDLGVWVVSVCQFSAQEAWCYE